MQIKHIFGPVPSRRLGISLGIDIIPFKTCTFNCLYCECGKTTQLTVQRKSFIDVEVIITELKKTLASLRHIDYLTFSGSGEPTLNADIGKMIAEIKKHMNPVTSMMLSISTAMVFMMNKKGLALSVLKIQIPAIDYLTENQNLFMPKKLLKICINTKFLLYF